MPGISTPVLNLIATTKDLVRDECSTSALPGRLRSHAPSDGVRVQGLLGVDACVAAPADLVDDR
ncbi:hypothetical protein CH267_00825 [Rhodococcus sp. 06-621-2]|nr:hypothetical protein CH267_00825 [Rhodococcus sp. 06-621-2]